MVMGSWSPCMLKLHEPHCNHDGEKNVEMFEKGAQNFLGKFVNESCPPATKVSNQIARNSCKDQ